MEEAVSDAIPHTSGSACMYVKNTLVEVQGTLEVALHLLQRGFGQEKRDIGAMALGHALEILSSAVQHTLRSTDMSDAIIFFNDIVGITDT
jgi:hypothetical protein